MLKDPTTRQKDIAAAQGTELGKQSRSLSESELGERITVVLSYLDYSDYFDLEDIFTDNAFYAHMGDQ